MDRQVHFNTSARLYENERGELAVRFADNRVYAEVALSPNEGFVTEALAVLTTGETPPEWRPIPFRKLLHDGQGWRPVGSMGFLDGDEARPAFACEVADETLGDLARSYLQVDGGEPRCAARAG